MGIGDFFNFQVSPMQIIYIPTGQKIVFRGADNPLENQVDQPGKRLYQIRLVRRNRSVRRDGRNTKYSCSHLFRGENKKRVAFYSYNPPKSGRSWVNQEAKLPRAGRRVHHSDYRSVPVDWLGRAFSGRCGTSKSYKRNRLPA
jgi:phage terminase large subunit